MMSRKGLIAVVECASMLRGHVLVNSLIGACFPANMTEMLATLTNYVVASTNLVKKWSR